MKPSLRTRIASPGPDRLVALWLAVWWAANLLQASLTELANDEAYYHMFAQSLAWGYFDHPPLTALLVRLGGMLAPGEAGVRLFFTLLQPLYLYLFWRLIRPADATRRDARLYVLLAASTLLLQLYGFIAVPDGPLLATAALYLWSFRRFAEGRRLAWLWMGVAMAAMAYAKYHGALVVLFSLAVNPGLLRRPALYLSGAVTALLLVPHLWWQYDHDWASFAYHLSARNAAFRPGYVVEFVGNMLVVFNPLLVATFVAAWRKTRPQEPLERALRWSPVLFVGFFLLTALRGYVQPQWVIVAVYGWLYVLFRYVRRHPRTRRYVVRACIATLALVALVRLEMIFNPLGLRFEVFDNRTSYGLIDSVAAGRPVIFRHGYAITAKYRFYTGGEAYCQPNIRSRTHQWQFRDDDSSFEGREVLIETLPPPGTVADVDTTLRVRSIALPNGRRFTWFVQPHFHPLRRIGIDIGGMPARVAPGDTLRLDLTVENPYSYAVAVGDAIRLNMLWKRGRRVEEFPVGARFCLPAREQRRIEAVVAVPRTLGEGRYEAGFALVRPGYTNWFNGKGLRVEVEAR